MAKSYIEERDGGYWISGTRISLDSIVYAFRRGAAPETIRRSFPLLSLEEIYGAITFYLANEPEVDLYIKRAETDLQRQTNARREQVCTTSPDLHQRLKSARQER